MILREELTKIALQTNLQASQIEKDYVLSWIIAAISEDDILSKSWIFKGGTCLRKCFFEDYRYSEDLDFTIINKSTASLEMLKASVSHIARWVYQKTGVEIDTSRSIFESVTNLNNQLILQGRIFYHGPASPSSRRAWPRIKLDITADEIVVAPPEQRKIFHPYSDYAGIKDYTVNTYNFYDLLAEKIRALFERTRPRDLYDVVEIFQRSSEINHDTLKKVLKEKCNYKNVSVTDLKSLRLEACASGWTDQLSHQLQGLSSFEQYLETFHNIYTKLKLD